MAKSLSTRAELQLSVAEALAQIKKLTAELKQVKQDVKQPLKLDVQVDTSKFEKQIGDVKKALGGARGSKSQFSTIASDIKGIRSELTKLTSSLTTAAGAIGNAKKQANDFSHSMQRSMSGGTQQITGLVNNVEQVNVSLRKASEGARGFKNEARGAFAAAMSGASSFVSGVDKAYTAFRSLGTSFLSTIGNIANQTLETVGFSVNGMVDEAMEQERKLQQSRIGFSNMFRGQDTTKMIQQVRQTAAVSPGLNSGDLANYINQLGAVSGGSFDTAFNATMGILKTVQYGGGDANAQMGYIIKNIRDVVAKGKATQVDVQQFNRAMPLLAEAMKAIGASEFLKNGQLTITKDNASKLMEAFAQLNTEANPAYNIFAQTGKTLAGIQEEFKEATASAIAEGLEGIGFFDALAEVAKQSLLPEVQGDIKEFFKWVGEVSRDIDWKAIQQTVGEVVKDIKGLIGDLAVYLKEEFLNTDSIKLMIRLVGEFLKGALDGFKLLLEAIDAIRDRVGDEGLFNLAHALGQAVTQGILLQRVLSGVAGVFETLAHVAEASYFFSLNFGGGKGGVARRVGGAMSSLTGGAITLDSLKSTKLGSAVGKGVGLAKRVGGVALRAGRTALKGGGIALATDVVSDLIRDFNLLGEATEGVANTLKVGGAAIGGAITGSILGPLGSLAGGLTSTVAAINNLQFEEEKRKAEEAGLKVNDIKDAKAAEILQGAINTLRASKTASGQSFTFNEGTDAAVWAKNQVIDFLNATEAKDWNEEDIYARLVNAYAQKLGQEFVTKIDNKHGFWDIQGSQVEYTTKNALGETEITKYGERLLEMIRAYNLVGYRNPDDLYRTSEESLIREYLQQENLNLGQLEFLEEQSRLFEKQTGVQLRDTSKRITDAIEEAGSIENAIEAAKKMGDEAFAAALECYRSLRDIAIATREEIVGLGSGNKYWDEKTATELIGADNARKYVDWVNRGGLDSVGDLLGEAATSFRNIFDTEGFSVSKAPAVVFKNLQEEMLKLESNAANLALPEAERAKDTAAANAIKAFLSNIPESGDWDTLTTNAYGLVLKLLENNRSLDLLTPAGRESVIVNGKEFSIEKTEAIMEEIRKWLAKYGKGAQNGWNHGGVIQPVFKAAGGGIGRGVDTVPAFLQPGEFVQRKSAVSTAGLGVMQALNNGDLAQAYRLIGSKISGSWNNSRNDYSQSDNRHYQRNSFFVYNGGRASRAGARASIANHLALGY